MAAPITGPHTEATPPNSVTTTACAETSMPKTESGVTTSSTQAYSPPAAAAIMPDTTSARIFHSRALMPAASAASSFCRIASRARPKREFSTIMQTKTPATSSPTATSVYRRGSVNSRNAAGCSRCIGNDISWNPRYCRK